MITLTIYTRSTWDAIAPFGFDAWYDENPTFAPHGSVSFLSVEALKAGLAEVTT